ncbi:MAG TPA: redox-regulated ATPase YchF, partial [Chthoniobacterales bacterium]|nr:redox-regulated ATPase YchF [Chthoniobacterales bacterium]
MGLPNVGKSTLFNAVTRTRKAQAANYPFCTIDPNQGIVSVPDPRLETLAIMSHSVRTVPAAIEFVDIAGLVAGASQGEGLGNQFLSHIREVDAIVQVVRCFESSDIHHVTGSVDPIRDIEVINTELILADLGSLQKRFERIQKQVRTGDKQARAEAAILEKLIPHLNGGKPATTLELNAEEKLLVRSFFLLTAKPTIFACNVSESDLGALSAGETG